VDPFEAEVLQGPGHQVPASSHRQVPGRIPPMEIPLLRPMKAKGSPVKLAVLKVAVESCSKMISGIYMDYSFVSFPELYYCVDYYLYGCDYCLEWFMYFTNIFDLSLINCFLYIYIYIDI
jgi:hypothetical protein